MTQFKDNGKLKFLIIVGTWAEIYQTSYGE